MEAIANEMISLSKISFASQAEKAEPSMRWDMANSPNANANAIAISCRHRQIGQ
jgi:predicted GTPase